MSSVLTDEQIKSVFDDESDRSGQRTMLEYARAIEQAVLQSEQVQELRRDAELVGEYRGLLDGAAAVLENCAEDMFDEGDEIGGHVAQSMADVINAAMEKKV